MAFVYYCNFLANAKKANKGKRKFLDINLFYLFQG
jgi:hypothetical protein